ncbi:hypothetical protein GCM10023080_089330 [Streptomyces pseudoechinosporeus]
MTVARAVPAAITGTATRLPDLSRSGELADRDVCAAASACAVTVVVLQRDGVVGHPAHRMT